MADINNSSALILYKETTITVPAGGQYVYQNPYEHVRILSCTGNYGDLVYRFGASSLETPLTVGLGLTMPAMLASFTIRNKGTGAVVLVIAESSRNIQDDRLTITGDVQTKNKPDTVQSVTLETFDANGEIAVDSSSYRSVLIQNMSSTDPIYIFANNTYKVEAGGTFEKDFAGQFTIYGTVGETATVGYFA